MQSVIIKSTTNEGAGKLAPFLFMKENELDAITKKLMKGKKAPATKKPEEPTTALGWLQKAYGSEADPKDGAPKVGKIGYV